jgi:hypothetical protein
MIIVCSWCRKEGKHEFLGDKLPFDDQCETHGICVIHYQQVRTHWQEVVRVTGSSGRPSSCRDDVWETLRHWSSLLNFARNRRL